LLLREVLVADLQQRQLIAHGNRLKRVNNRVASGTSSVFELIVYGKGQSIPTPRQKSIDRSPNLRCQKPTRFVDARGRSFTLINMQNPAITNRLAMTSFKVIPLTLAERLPATIAMI
jgi:hypothetical protein